MSTPFDKVLDGNITSAAAQVYSGAMGDWWMVVIVIFTIASVYISTRDEGATAAATLVLVAFLKWLDSIGKITLGVLGDSIFYTVVVFGLALVLYKLFWGGDR